MHSVYNMLRDAMRLDTPGMACEKMDAHVRASSLVYVFMRTLLYNASYVYDVQEQMLVNFMHRCGPTSTETSFILPPVCMCIYVLSADRRRGRKRGFSRQMCFSKLWVYDDRGGFMSILPRIRIPLIGFLMKGKETLFWHVAYGWLCRICSGCPQYFLKSCILVESTCTIAIATYLFGIT